MSTETETHDDTDDTNLDDFSAEFFGQTKADPEPTKPEVEEITDDGIDAQPEVEEAQDDDDGTDTPEDEQENEDESEEEESEAEEPKPKPKKNSAQERISELTAARREAERRADALEQRLAALEGKNAPETPAPAPKPAEGPAPPKPTDTNEDGSEKYPLGEFDPNFITDLADFRVEQRFAERERQEEERQVQAQQREQMTQLESHWNENLNSARERYPDYEDKAANLAPVFDGIDPAYGEYLQTTLMSMDNGAEVLYHLANNPDEARRIVESGPQKATIALGRLEARFVSDVDNKPTRPLKTTKAPAPPPTNKGSSAARTRVAPDTDDLDAFSAEFFKK